MYSSWVFVNVIAVLFCIPSHIIQFNAHLYSPPMLSIQLAHSGVFKSAYPCSSKLAASFGIGMNVTLLILVFGIHINLYTVPNFSTISFSS